MVLRIPLAPLLVLSLALPSTQEQSSAFQLAISAAERALEGGDTSACRAWIERALERDRKSTLAWDLRARWARAVGDRDEEVYARHREYGLAVAQRRARAELLALRERLDELDPVAKDVYGMKERFIGRLAKVAEGYEKQERPHGAIQVYRKILSLDPENAQAAEAIERIARTPDPSLAEHAKPKDLFADVSEEWIREFDAEHSSWKERAKMERDNYTTYTDAGYVVLVRVAEAMEQMNAFYRIFFRHGTEEDGGSVPRIGVNIFKNRDEYLTLGIGPPVEWSGGHFTGNFVETYVGEGGGFEQMTGTLFHEAAHQFVSLATNAAGWLNEGLASFFEGTRILPNGTVIMNMPADHRLMPLAERMEKGWMSSASEGLDSGDPDQTPEKAPTFRIVLENEYSWGPPWYAPTWGVVFFLFNYQDPVDGRFVYRDSFWEFVNSSGGRVGKGAVRNFEEVVLANPAPALEGIERPEDAPEVALPRDVGELTEVWKQWMFELRDLQQGKLEAARPYHQWGRFAAANKQYKVAKEHFEKGLVEDPDDIELLMDFADLLSSKHFENPDRASRLVLEAIHYMESQSEPDEDRIRQAERLLARLDPKRRTLTSVLEEMLAEARSVLARYEEAGMPTMVMDLAWRLGRDLEFSELFALYEDALRRTGKSLEIWQLAYNEKNLEGWNVAGEDAFRADGVSLVGQNGAFSADDFTFQIVTLDQVASGDFSMDAEVQANRGEVNFCGFVFGRKGDLSFHGMVLFPGKTSVAAGVAETGFIDLMSSYGAGRPKTWTHDPVQTTEPLEEGRSSSAAGDWHHMQVNVSGPHVDMWFDGEFVAMHEFPSAEVLRGGFGLIMGPGTARFRNVRYLSRDPRDPASRIERAIRLEPFTRARAAPAAASAKGEGAGSEPGAEPAGPVGATPADAVNGRYKGMVPPWPEVRDWVAGEPRSSWREAGSVPQLLVFFSIEQNEIVPIDAWLRDLAARTERYGMRIVCVASPNDLERIESYLGEHPFPGSVGVDNRDEGTVGIGDSNEMFFIRKFNLPRLLLLDLDQTVAWEGDPGFGPSAPYPDVEAYLEDPLDALVADRKLEQLASWRLAWAERAAPALEAGDVAAAIPTLIDSRQFDARYSTEVALAQARLAAIEGAVQDPVAAARELQDAGADPAIHELLAWLPLFELELTRKLRADLKDVLQGDAAKDWSAALQAIEKARKTHGEWSEKGPELLARCERWEGLFVGDLRADLQAALDAGDDAAFERLLDEAPARPLRWLTGTYFGW